MVAAALREPAQVLGDGRSSVRELVTATNQDPRRSAGHATMLSLIELDGIALAVLAEQDLTPDAVPATGQRVLLRRAANLSTGGTATDVTDQVHAAVAARALEAAQMVGLDLAGVDILAADIGRPLEEQGGAVVEVNAGPGLRMHLEPSAGQPRPVGEAIVDLLFPHMEGAGADGRIPLVAVIGASGSAATARLIAHLLQGRGDLVGLASRDGIEVGTRCIDPHDGTGPEAARTLLMHPRLEAVVLSLAAGGIRREGLGFDRCQVGVVTEVGETAPAGEPGIETLDDLVRVKRCVVEAVTETGCAVLNAEDPRVAEMAESCRGNVLWFARDPEHPSVVAGLAQGGRAVVERDGCVVLAAGEATETLLPLAQVPLTDQSQDNHQTQSILAAVAAAWALGLPPDLIRSGLLTLLSTP